MVKRNLYKKIGCILVLFSIFTLSTYFIYNYCVISQQEKKVVNYLANKVDIVDQVEKDHEEAIKETTKEKPKGILEIPTINFRQAFYAIDSKENNVNKNIEVLKNSKMPNEKGILAIAGHSGNSPLGFFKNLVSLSLKDKIMVYFEHNLYCYEITNIYEEPKTGEVKIFWKSNETIILLTTCSQRKDMQLNIIGNLVETKVNE